MEVLRGRRNLGGPAPVHEAKLVPGGKGREHRGHPFGVGAEDSWDRGTVRPAVLVGPAVFSAKEPTESFDTYYFLGGELAFALGRVPLVLDARDYQPLLDGSSNHPHFPHVMQQVMPCSEGFGAASGLMSRARSSMVVTATLKEARKPQCS